MIGPVMTYVHLAFEFLADNQLLKLQQLQNKVLRTTGIFKSHTGPRFARLSAFNI
jgi:hypothetical protein